MAANSLRTTAHDMAQFLSSYSKKNAVLKKETLQQMFIPEPATVSTWALGHEVYIENNSGSHVIGHGGGAFPRTGASIRVNPVQAMASP